MNKIILVDDDRFVLEQLSEIIDWKLFGFECAGIFIDGSEALSYIRSFHVDACITDIKMNSMSGLKLIEICKKEFPDIKFAVISAHRDFEYAHQALKFGVNEYILKPIMYNDFVSCVEKLSQSITQQPSENETVPIHTTDTLLTAIAYINEHLNEAISLNDVASHVGFHPNYFSLYFKQNIGETFLSFLTKMRITKAKQLLRNTDIKISAICDMVGYKNQTHFYNIFRKYTDDLTPLQYRNRFQGGHK